MNYRIYVMGWDVIRSFVDNAVAKYIFAIPSLCFVLFGFEAVGFRIFDSIMRLQIVASYVFFFDDLYVGGGFVLRLLS